MNAPETNRDADATVALAALGWLLSDSARAERLLAVTGLTAADLRSRLNEPDALAAILGFLEAHEPDLVACAEAIGQAPESLVSARRNLES